MMEIFFLGTGGSVPSRDRNLPSIVIRRKGEIFIFDCGECMQKRFLLNHIGVNKPTYVFITHLHGDHVFGLPGLLSTFSLLGRSLPIEIYGPKPIKRFIESILENTYTNLQYEVVVKEVTPGCIFEKREYYVICAWAKHSVPTLAYSLVEKDRPGRFNVEKALALGIPKGPLWKKLQMGYYVDLPNGRRVYPEDVLGPPRKGLKVTYTGDTAPCSEIVKLAYGSTLLIHDSTFTEEYREEAEESLHSTARQAAEVALKSHSKELALFHISPRITDDEKILMEAKAVFPNTFVAIDNSIKVLRYED